MTGVNDEGESFTLSPDPNLPVLTSLFAGFALGTPTNPAKLHALFSREDLFGVDLYRYGLGKKAEDMFAEMSRGVGCIRTVLERYLQGDK